MGDESDPDDGVSPTFPNAHSNRIFAEWRASEATTRQQPVRREIAKDELSRVIADHMNWLCAVGGKRAELVAVNLSNTNCSKVAFARADLRQANFAKSNLAEANFNHSDLTDAVLSSANLRKAILAAAKLVRADLSRADLSECSISMGADLQNANCEYANFSHAYIGTVNLSRARLRRAVLTKADMTGTMLSGADLTDAELQGAVLTNADLSDAELYGCDGMLLDRTYIRGAHFAPVTQRWSAVVRNSVLPRLRKWAERRKWERVAYWLDLSKAFSDPWSILRQFYAGPRILFLFFFVVLFALPYVGRAAFYSAVGPVERRLSAQAETKKHELETRLAANPGDQLARAELEHLNAAFAKVEPRPVWQVLLKWDEGNVWPTVLAVLLILYNVGVYLLISSVSPLRDGEERSGWSPAWADYRHLIWIHRAVTLLFYVSFVSFVVNVGQVLFDVVYIVKAG